MKHILAEANRRVLRQFARARVLLAFDYDGTLAPIVTDPSKADLPPATRALLADVASRYPCIVISGRTRADVARRLRGIRTVEVIGNHGIEPWQSSERGQRAVRRWRPVLERRLARFAGVEIEDKVHSLAVHYRRSPEKDKARLAVNRAAAALGDVRLVRGKQVVNVLPSGAPHKGVALREARARFRCEAAIYVGDDETDEDVFALNEPDRLLSIRVGRKRGSHAAYFLRAQPEIDRLLRALAQFRECPAPCA